MSDVSSKSAKEEVYSALRKIMAWRRGRTNGMLFGILAALVLLLMVGVSSKGPLPAPTVWLELACLGFVMIGGALGWLLASLKDRHLMVLGYQQLMEQVVEKESDTSKILWEIERHDPQWAYCQLAREIRKRAWAQKKQT